MPETRAVESSFSISSPLGSWTHHECRPPTLRGVVDHLWHFDGEMLLPRERTFPGGYFEIILHLGPLFRDVRPDGRTGAPFPTACVTGAQTQPLVIESPAGRCCVLGIRLTPTGAFRVLRTPLNDAANATLDLADVVDRSAADLADACRDCVTVSARFERVISWLQHRLGNAPEVHAGVAHAAYELAAGHGNRRIGELQQTSGLSRPRFLSLFRAQTGYAPKQLARILRFRRTLTALQRGQRLSDAALDAGYFDQAHMHADFHNFAGMTPAAFVSATRYPNSPSLPESP